jgi:hypothetical protein
VHEQLERALAAFEDSVEVMVRGAAYIVHLKQTPMKQVLGLGLRLRVRGRVKG